MLNTLISKRSLLRLNKIQEKAKEYSDLKSTTKNPCLININAHSALVYPPRFRGVSFYEMTKNEVFVFHVLPNSAF